MMPVSMHADSAWILKKDRNNIQVFTRAIPDSPYHAAKLITELDSDLETVAKAIGNGQECNAWIKMCKKVTLLEQISPEEMFFYTVLDFPFPLKDRESVLHVTTQRSHDLKSVTITMQSADDKYPQQSYIRMVSDITYKIQDLDNNKVRFTWFVQSNPGGNVKTSLYNARLPKDTYKDVLRLRNLLQSGKAN
ncbi:MAG: hypothetical protein HKN88_02815 [Gammaproteobacteria bacterium]|nr:hypothetical protein [Gammaproteobacteria bacterium]NNC96984.1 hypothetical protein [Gammaproteobacteria bacterium]NNM13429.1 hypothetical protein [Gammaproteobacteria bacterium]